MFTSSDKAIVALIMAGAYLAQQWFHVVPPAWLNEQTIETGIAIVTPLLVWTVPNKPKA